MSETKRRAVGYRQIPNAAFETDEITAEGYRTLAAVQFYDRMGGNGRGCDASVATIATKALCDIRTAQRWLSRLTNMGLLSVERKVGRGATNVYNVIYEQSEKGDGRDTLYDAERVTAVTEKGDSAILEDVLDQSVIPPKDTLKDTSAKLERIHSDKSAPFPEKPPENSAGSGYVAYLSMVDRLGRNTGLPSHKIKEVMDVAEATMSLFENGTPEYGIAYRIAESYYLTPEDNDADEQFVQ